MVDYQVQSLASTEKPVSESLARVLLPLASEHMVFSAIPSVIGFKESSSGETGTSAQKPEEALLHQTELELCHVFSTV